MIVCTKEKELAGVNVYLKPTYAVVMPARTRERGPLTEMQKNNMKHLEKNQHEGKLSQKSSRKLVNSVNWLVAAAKKKWYFDKTKNRHFSFKVNFVTLTLPGDVQEISDHKFKSILMHGFINQCRYRYGLKNFIWKVEAQENGKIHAHFTTDTYLPWRGVRDIWNSLLKHHNLLDFHVAKHSAMSYADYCKAYNSDGEHSEKLMTKRFKEGTATGWTDPNSTDVHAVFKVRDIAAYLAKYMSKKEEGRRSLKGRLWACSYNISQANSLSVNVPFDLGSDSLDPFLNGNFEWHEIRTADKDGVQGKKVGEIFYFKLQDLGTKIFGPIGDLYKKTLFNIRNGIQLDFEPRLLPKIKEIKNQFKHDPSKIKPMPDIQLSLFPGIFENVNFKFN